MMFRLVAHSKIVSNFDSKSDFDSNAYFPIAPPDTPISLWSSLRVSLRVCIVVPFSC